MTEQSRMSQAWAFSKHGTRAKTTTTTTPLTMTNSQKQMTTANFHQPSTIQRQHQQHQQQQQPPLVASTPYTRRVSNFAHGTATISYQPQQHHQQQQQQQFFRAPANWQQRQTVVAFKQTPTFYEAQQPKVFVQQQQQQSQQRQPFPNFHRATAFHENTYLNVDQGSLNRRSVRAAPAQQKPQQAVYYMNHQTSSDSCCSSCCSIASNHLQTSGNQQLRRGSCDSNTFSCSSTCSSCSCHFQQRNGKQPVKPIIKQQSSFRHPNYQSSQQKSYESRTLDNRSKSTERRRTVGSSSHSDLIDAQRFSDEKTPTPGTGPDAAIYCNNEVVFVDRRSKTALGASTSKLVSTTPIQISVSTSRLAPHGPTQKGLDSSSLRSSSTSNKSGLGKQDENNKTFKNPSIYATQVQTPATHRSTKSAMLNMRLREVQNREQSRLNAANNNDRTTAPRTPASSRVRVGDSATRCVPVPSSNDRFLWVDGQGHTQVCNNLQAKPLVTEVVSRKQSSCKLNYLVLSLFVLLILFCLLN